MRDVISFFGHYLFKNGKHSKNRICLSTLTAQSANTGFDPSDWGNYGMIFTPIIYSNQTTHEKIIKQLSSFIQKLAPIENLNIIQLFYGEMKCTQLDYEDYAHAVRNAFEAGFDGAEIQITDNRLKINQAHLARDILKACRYVVPKEFLLGFRIAPENQQAGIDLDDSLDTAERLAQDGADFITLSLSNVLLPSTKYLHLSNKPILAYFRERLGNHYPLLVAGNVAVPSDAQKALESGASFVAINM
jgi:hypothetical protein